MAKSERNAMPDRGGNFFHDGEDVMFQFVIDPGNVVGPRLATPADKDNHPHLWAQFEQADITLAKADQEPKAAPKSKAK